MQLNSQQMQLNTQQMQLNTPDIWTSAWKLSFCIHLYQWNSIFTGTDHQSNKTSV